MNQAPSLPPLSTDSLLGEIADDFLARLDRGEPGYQVGAYMFNLIAAELVFVAAMVGIVLATWPEPPWELLTWGGAALMVLLPVVFYPFAKTLFLAFDLVFRPEG